jgi:protein-S-isoprenylcysteine O-methyltransferase Ste14
MSGRAKSILLVAFQSAAILCILLTGPLVAHPWPWLVMEGAGLLLGIASVVAVRPRYLTVFPEPRSGGRLVTAGPYRRLRHPMYAAGLLVTLALLLSRPTTDRLLAWVFLLVVLLIKMPHEERLLSARFPEYEDYRRKTRRLIPHLY